MPVAPPISGQGQGLCVASSVSAAPTVDFPQTAGAFNAGLNAFMEANKANRVKSVLQTVFDLSND